MTTSLVIHRASDGSNLQAVLSLTAIKSLSSAQITALNNLGIRRVSDLLQFKPVHDSRLILLAARGQIAHDLSLADLLSPSGAAIPLHDLTNAPTTSLVSVSQAVANVMKNDFGVQTVAQLAEFNPFLEAQRFLISAGEVFREPASAPDELMPQMIGSVESTATYSTFVKEKTLRLEGLALVYDQERKHYVDSSLAALFPVHGLQAIATTFLGKQLAPLPDPDVVLHLGFVSKSTQRWVNTGTSLGEIVYSLALAPGESRNIAILDWTRSQRTKRSEDTTAREQLTNNLFHVRALDECTAVTAGEHQNGGTLLAAGTLATAGARVASVAMVGGLAGALPGSAIGAFAGAALGAPTGPGDLATTLAGAAAGAVIGFGIGAAGATSGSQLGAANAQLGVLRTDSSGNRTVTTDVHQDIAERISQNASNIRSLRSNIFVSDDQSETQNLTGRNITNYNHSHMLNLQYYEVLQRYRAELRMTAAEPLLFLPFRPLDFNLELIKNYWSILRTGVEDLELRKNFDRLVRFDQEEIEQTGNEVLLEVTVAVTRVSPDPITLFRLRTVLPSVSLLVHKEDSRPLVSLTSPPAATDLYMLKLTNEAISFAQVVGVQVENLVPNEEVLIDLFLRMKDDRNGASRSLSLRQLERKAREDGTLLIEMGKRTQNQPEAPSLDELYELEHYFNAKRYFFTRLLLLSIEKEQIIDLVEALMFQSEAIVNRTASNIDFSRFQPVTFAARVALPDLVIQDLREELESYLMTGIKASGVRPALTNAQIQQLSQAMMSQMRRVLASPEAQAKTTTDLAAEIKQEVQTIVQRAKLPQATVGSLSQRVAEAFRKRFNGIRTIPGVATPGVHLSEFIEPEPLAITGNTLVFRMKKISNAPIQQNPLTKQHLLTVLEHSAEIEKFIETKKSEVSTQDVFLPTSGVFAEAILGRANASERVDATRFINWQDMPIPNAAPLISDLQLQSLRGEPLDTTATIPSSVLNIVNPPAFPDTTARDALSVLNNGNLFRDMSRSDVLAGVLNNLSSLANNQSQMAGNLAGQAQQEALRQAANIASKVADLAALFAQSTSTPPVTDTSKAGLLNQILGLLGDGGLGADSSRRTSATPGGGSIPGSNGGSGGAIPGDGDTAPGSNASTPESGLPSTDLLEEIKHALGVSSPVAAANGTSGQEPEIFEYAFRVSFEDLNGKPTNPQFMLINPQAGGVSESIGMNFANIPVPMNVRDLSGDLKVITPNLEASIKLPKNSKGKVILTAAMNDLVSLVGEEKHLNLGDNQDRFVILQARMESEKISVDAADEAEARRKVLALAEPTDGSASILKLGAGAKEMKDFFKVEREAAGKFTVLVPNGCLEVIQLSR